MNPIIMEGRIINNTRLTAGSRHLKIFVEHFPTVDAVAITGYALPLFAGDAYQTGAPLLRTPVWDMDPLHCTIDIVITPGVQTPLHHRILNSAPGGLLQLLPPEPVMELQEDTATYYFIGNATSLAFLYQVNRNLPFVKNVESLIISDVAGMFFPDTDRSHPFCYEVIYPFNAERVIDFFTSRYPHPGSDATFILAADPVTNHAFTHFFTRQWGIDEKRIKIATFEDI
ncbi:MAG TPA: hypothetical protein VM802_19420 [Chitinophaga sp.]|uniref:hypothetical protein n=1 Tax=Chitinophaga sp. TaxID=1869181 RepID=UPI002CCF140A|nr:hypothetical protein [Chitinophaga sp.]HVI47056.1 hypothetical protein [Chitinophaga sp.]